MFLRRYVHDRVQSWWATRDVVEILTSDHREMVELLGQIEQTSETDRRRDLADTLIAEVMRHAVAEEMYVYPAVEG